MLKTKFNYIFLLIIVIFISCNKENNCDCIKSTGDIIFQKRDINSFNTISLSDNINLYITQDTIFSLTIEAGANLLKLIKTDVIDTCLYIQNKNTCNWVRSFKNKINIYLKCKEINFLKYNNASGNIYTSDTLHSKYFQFDSNDGTGDINLTINANSSWFNLHTGPAMLNVNGISGVNYLYSAGNGLADLRNLITGYTFMNNKSTNNCFVNVQQELEVKIGYVGDVYYTGNPYVINTQINGSGKLININ